MLIGEVSKLTGLSRDTIRFYEKSGLIGVNKKDRRENNYKEYSADTLKKLLTIKRIKSFGFTLNEASEFLELIAGNNASCDNVANKVYQKISLIDEKIKEMQEMKAFMLNGESKCQNCCTEESKDNCLMLTSDDFMK